MKRIMNWIEKRPVYFSIILFVVSLALRLYKLTDESLWYDEVLGIGFVSGKESIFEVFQSMQSVNTQAPLYYFIVFFLFKIFGPSELMLRLPSAIFGAFAVVVMFFVAKKLFNSKVALLSAVLLMINRAFVFHSQDGKSYALFVLLSLLSVYLFLEMSKPTKTKTFLFILVNILNFYTHFFAGFVIFVESIFLLWPHVKYFKFDEHFWSKFSYLGIIYILMIPQIIFFFATDIGVLQQEVQWGMEINPVLFMRDVFTEFMGVPFRFPILFMVLFGLGVYYAKPSEHKFELTLMVIPIVAVYMMTVLLNMPFLPRHFTFILPFYLMFLAKCAFSLKDKRFTAVLAIGLLLFSLVQLNYLYSIHTNEEWKELVKDMAEYEGANDLILIHADYMVPTFDFYYSGNNTIMGLLASPKESSLNDEFLNVLPEMRGKNQLFLIRSSHHPSFDYYMNKMDESFLLVGAKKYIGIIAYQYSLKESSIMGSAN